MGRCIYCGREAGFLRKKHPECEKKHFEGRSQIYHMAEDAILKSDVDLKALKEQIYQVAVASFVNPPLLQKLLTGLTQLSIEQQPLCLAKA